MKRGSEPQVEESQMGETCPHCEKRKQEMEKREETHFAILVSLVPVMTFMLFNMMGLY